MQVSGIPGAILLAGFLVVSCLFIELQIKLSKKENKFLGLILPIITFSISMINLVIVVVGPIITNLFNKQPNYVDGRKLIDFGPESFASFPQILLMFFVSNIPTIFFMSIYFSYRKRKSSQNLSK